MIVECSLSIQAKSEPEEGSARWCGVDFAGIPEGLAGEQNSFTHSSIHFLETRVSWAGKRGIH